MRILAVLLMALSCAWAQVERAVLIGTVTDPTGAAVPGASVVVRNNDTGAEVTLSTDERGYYVSGPLWPGRYLVTIEASGFKMWTREVSLDVNQRAQVDASLVVGAMTEKVTITGESPLLETQSVTMGNVRTESAIRNLPLKGATYSTGVAGAGRVAGQHQQSHQRRARQPIRLRQRSARFQQHVSDRWHL